MVMCMLCYLKFRSLRWTLAMLGKINLGTGKYPNRVSQLDEFWEVVTKGKGEHTIRNFCVGHHTSFAAAAWIQVKKLLMVVWNTSCFRSDIRRQGILHRNCVKYFLHRSCCWIKTYQMQSTSEAWRVKQQRKIVHTPQKLLYCKLDMCKVPIHQQQYVCRYMDTDTHVSNSLIIGVDFLSVTPARSSRPVTDSETNSPADAYPTNQLNTTKSEAVKSWETACSWSPGPVPGNEDCYWWLYILPARTPQKAKDMPWQTAPHRKKSKTRIQKQQSNIQHFLLFRGNLREQIVRTWALTFNTSVTSISNMERTCIFPK